MFTDSHCHLTYPGLAERLPEVRQAMADTRVDRALCVCTTLEEFGSVHALATGDDGLWCSVGVHPDNEGVEEPTVAGLVERAALPRVVAIGETGLDYYGMEDRKGGRSIADLEWQRDRFRVHIRAARATGLPLIIHTRSASDDTLVILREEGASHGVFHCFTETDAVARAALDRGFYISFSGILTFKNAAALREVAKSVPDDRLLIETDSPYLAPVPYRGKTNMPAYVPHVARQLAELRGSTVEDIAALTSRNFDRLFSRAAAA
ncbi:TatD family hydrolase [Xylophilus sp.]|uniref:TatD family hydrolase n=1 Tax=Xylophilus sp. TaxID=2653893 RepID=UPI0013B67C19|nr:TatD family hydrolase [Xylophilus sp.]KAF1048700.1 MAG: putative metal-dependent hydrolase YcfH [Xylophilus sp.]